MWGGTGVSWIRGEQSVHRVDKLQMCPFRTPHFEVKLAWDVAPWLMIACNVCLYLFLWVKARPLCWMSSCTRVSNLHEDYIITLFTIIIETMSTLVGVLSIYILCKCFFNNRLLWTGKRLEISCVHCFKLFSNSIWQWIYCTCHIRVIFPCFS